MDETEAKFILTILEYFKSVTQPFEILYIF